MMVGIGMDLVEVPRMAKAIERGGERLLARLFTGGEREDARGRDEAGELASRFAAKEAALKALGTGWSGGISWRDVEVQRDGSGRLVLALAGRAAAIARERGVARAFLSVSRDGALAGAVVILEAAA